MALTTYFVFGITFAFAAAVQPGPFLTFLIAQTLKKGWRSTLPAAFAPVISDGPIILLSLLLLSTLSIRLVDGLRIGGGVFLMYLGYNAFNAFRTYNTDETVRLESNQQTLFQAVTVNLLNPSPYLAWSLILGPLFLEGWRHSPAHGVAFLGSFYLTMVLTLIGLISLFASARKLGPRVCRVLLGFSAAALAAFGVYQVGLGICNLTRL